MATFQAMMETLDPDGTLPPADYAHGFEPEFSELSEAEQREVRRLEAMSPEELLEEALADPDVRAVVEAAEGMEPVAL